MLGVSRRLLTSLRNPLDALQVEQGGFLEYPLLRQIYQPGRILGISYPPPDITNISWIFAYLANISFIYTFRIICLDIHRIFLYSSL